MAGNPRKKHWVGFDLGGTKMMATVFDKDFKALGSERRKTKGHEGVKSGLERLVQTIHDALQQAQVEPTTLAGIGIGTPGAVDLDRGLIQEAANLGWKDVRLKDRLEKEFGCPAVVLNDVDAGVYGEYRFGAGQEARCVFGIFPGTGIGGGFVYDGQILRGKKFSCMEVGHLQVTRHGRICGCGRRGCLETEASRLSIASDAAAAAFRGDAPHLMQTVGTDVAKIRSGALAESIKAGDVVVERIVRRAAEYIGIAVGNVINLLLPDVVVVGGGLAEALPKWYLETIDEAARNHAMNEVARTFRVVGAKLGDNANVMGAAAWAQLQLGVSE
jgi:glucokinase